HLASAFRRGRPPQLSDDADAIDPCPTAISKYNYGYGYGYGYGTHVHLPYVRRYVRAYVRAYDGS
ncbi:MAG TPA: hypothetical protein PLA44_14970, partial [Propionibacteriaceae bacterium]|nr:hypothetical protein [Propionibacteriaceae bacterium]